MKTRKITIEVSEETVELLEVLARSAAVPTGGVEEVLRHLAYSAADGVRRPGAWERSWIEQAFGGDWHAHVEKVPGVPWNVRPKKKSSPS